MTGFGEAHTQQEGLTVGVEVRAVNSRFFKLAIRVEEGYGALEPQIEAILRKAVRRGTVQVNVRVDRVRSPEDFKINVEVLDCYWAQLDSVHRRRGLSQPVSLEALLMLPGVVDDDAVGAADPAADWALIARTLQTAVENLNQMRLAEGRSMAADLRANSRAAAASLEQVRQRAPLLAEAYRARLEERVKRILAEHDVVLDPGDLVREVGLFAERSDISEEIVRLQSHLDQFDRTMESPESSGRKLEFLTQEMLRETNTIGSKAADVEIAQQVIEIKTAIERIREMIQNVE